MWYPTNKSYEAIAKIAEKDIPIIKVGTSLDPKIFTSDFMVAKYRLNKSVPRVRILTGLAGEIAEGYHFYKPNMVTICRSETIRSLNGLYRPPHICSRFEPYHVHYVFGVNTVIAKGFIPKGTIYYLNSRGEGVAEQIYLTEMIKL